MTAVSKRWKTQHLQRRVGEWVAAEMAKVREHGQAFAEDLAHRSRSAIGSEVPVATIKAHVFAIQRRLVKAATEATNG